MQKKLAGLAPPLLLIFPIAGFLTSLYNVRSKTSAIVYVAFAMLFGYAIAFTNSSADSFRYAEAFIRFDSTMDYDTILELYQKGELRDMYRLLLFYFTSLFSNNPKVMYAFAGLVYGVFSYLSLRVFVKERGVGLDFYVFALTLVFFTYISISNVNGFRFWTGGVILFYSVYQFIIQKKTKWIVGILITPFIHYGFVLIVPVFILYKLIERLLYNKARVLPILFYTFVLAYIASWVLGTNSIDLSFLSKTDALSGAVGDRLDYVNSSDVASLVESRRESSLFLGVQKYFDYGIKIYVFIALVFIKKKLNRMTGNKTAFNKLLAFVLFFYAVAFIATTIPSGGRFLNIAHLFFMLLLGKFYAVYKEADIKRLILWALPVYSFNILFINLALPFLILTPSFWFSNVFWIIIEGLDFSLYVS